MVCREAEQLVEPYINNELSGRKLEAFMEHIKSCSACYEELEINFTLYAAIWELDNNPNASYNIKSMFLEKLNHTDRRLKKLKNFRIVSRTIKILAAASVASMLCLQLALWTGGEIKGIGMKIFSELADMNNVESGDRDE